MKSAVTAVDLFLLPPPLSINHYYGCVNAKRFLNSQPMHLYRNHIGNACTYERTSIECVFTGGSVCGRVKSEVSPIRD